MAYKQPRVPEYRDSDGPVITLKNLIMFLRDFCLSSWNADKKKDAEIENIKKRLKALEEE